MPPANSSLEVLANAKEDRESELKGLLMALDRLNELNPPFSLRDNSEIQNARNTIVSRISTLQYEILRLKGYIISQSPNAYNREDREMESLRAYRQWLYTPNPMGLFAAAPNETCDQWMCRFGIYSTEDYVKFKRANDAVIGYMTPDQLTIYNHIIKCGPVGQKTYCARPTSAAFGPAPRTVARVAPVGIQVSVGPGPQEVSSPAIVSPAMSDAYKAKATEERARLYPLILQIAKDYFKSIRVPESDSRAVSCHRRNQ